MSLAQLRVARKVVVAMQHATAVFAAFCVIALLDDGRYISAAVCAACFVVAVSGRIPEVPDD